MLMSTPCITLTEVRYPEHLILHLRTSSSSTNATMASQQQASPTTQPTSSAARQTSSSAQQVSQSASAFAVYNAPPLSVSDSITQLATELNESPLFRNYRDLIRVWHTKMTAEYLQDLESLQGRQTASVNIYMLIDQVINKALSQHVNNDDALLAIDDFYLKLKEVLLHVLPERFTLATISDCYHKFNKEYEEENAKIPQVHAHYDQLLQDLIALTDLTVERISSYFETIKQKLNNLNTDRISKSEEAYKKLQALNQQVKALERAMAQRGESVAANGIALLRQKEILLQIYQKYSDLVQRV